jgi:haloacetate dehalogenase
MAFDHPDRVEKLAVLDIVPTSDMWRRVDMDFGMVDWHWFFLAQPAPLPEDLLGSNPEAYYFRGDRSRFDPEALDDYLRCARNPETIHAMCEDYRAGATFDRELDEADRGKRRIACPVLVLWSGREELGRWFDVLEVWRGWADDVRGRPLDCGHYLAEERPEEVYEELRRFFSER